MWVFFAEGTGEFAGWYVNLETPHVRDRGAVFTSGHVLDVLVDPDRRVHRKDEDELELAVAQGVFDPAGGASTEADAAEVEAVVAAWGPPFCDGWEGFSSDPEWPIAGLVPGAPRPATSSSPRLAGLGHADATALVPVVVSRDAGHPRRGVGRQVRRARRGSSG